jgi:hypothetical protein
MKQFICDYCGEIINQPSHGLIEYLSTYNGHEKNCIDFKIIHHESYSPKSSLQSNNFCYHHKNKSEWRHLHLDYVINLTSKERSKMFGSRTGKMLKKLLAT